MKTKPVSRKSTKRSEINILVVDDDEAIRKFFTDIWEKRGHHVKAVSNGQEALREILKKNYHLVITDLKMPKMNGLNLVKEINKKAPNTVIVAMTGAGTIKDAVSLMKEGAFDVLAKPFGIDEINIVVDKALKHQELRYHNEELRRRLRVSEKLALIGRLAAGVAHELNNPLDGVMRFVNLSIDQSHGEAKIREYLTEAKEGLKRMADIVRSLLHFSRNVAIENELAVLGELLQKSISEFKHLPSFQKCRFLVHLEDESIKVPSGLVQVFINVIKNSLDAMEDAGGTLSIQSQLADGSLLIKFGDTGCGIASKNLDKVFEPFFTTKGAGKGTGLGLSICARIMEKFNGSLKLESTEGRGTVVTLNLPMEFENNDKEGKRKNTGSG